MATCCMWSVWVNIHLTLYTELRHGVKIVCRLDCSATMTNITVVQGSHNKYTSTLCLCMAELLLDRNHTTHEMLHLCIVAYA